MKKHLNTLTLKPLSQEGYSSAKNLQKSVQNTQLLRTCSQKTIPDTQMNTKLRSQNMIDYYIQQYHRCKESLTKNTDIP